MAELRSPLRRLARLLGQCITFLALFYLVYALYQNRAGLGDWSPTWREISVLVALTVAYGAILLLLAFNWAVIVEAVFPDRHIPRTYLMLSYTQTQIAKYVPGNVIHLVSRHMYLRDLALDHRPLAAASLIELLSLPVSACLGIFLGIAVSGDLAISENWTFTPVISLVILLALLGTVMVICHQYSYRAKVTLSVLARGAVFMFGQGTIFAVVLQVTSGTFVALAIPCAVLAWLIGFVTPGAPGGLAVREAVLIAVLAQITDGQALLLAAIVFRLVTTAGDLVLYLFGAFVLQRLVAKAGA